MLLCLVYFKILGHIAIEVLIDFGDEDIRYFVEFFIQFLCVSPHIMLQKLLNAVFVVFLFVFTALLLSGVVAALQEQFLSYQPRHLLLAK